MPTQTLKPPPAVWSETTPEGRTRLSEIMSKVVVYRGQHGDSDAIQTRESAVAFGSMRAARVYATSPNDPKDHVVEPKIFEAYLHTYKPIAFSNPRDRDPFIDLAIIEREFGPEIVEDLIHMHADALRNTNSYEELYNETGRNLEEMIWAWRDGDQYELPPIEAWRALSTSSFKDALLDRGVDLVIAGGSGETAMELEFLVIDQRIIDVVAIHKPDQAPDADRKPASGGDKPDDDNPPGP